MSELIQSLEGWVDYRDRVLASGQPIGLVATMGALHEGHLELIRRARTETDCVVVSVFLNPTQFNDPKDLERYPKTLGVDLSLATEAGANVIFAPSRDSLYPDNFSYKVAETVLSSNLEGEHRPGHFEGVLTVVMKLLNLVRPTRAYFGEKDYQQLKLIEGMARAFFLGVEIVPVATVREADGLALSSRNVHLTAEGRKMAPEFHRSLKQTTTIEEVRRDLEDKGFTVEYVEEVGQRRLGAVVLENVRLIDNVPI
ncbi:MAG: pantoate--beta-alanine ligase [Opitutaceae bacterium]|nr:pantoate--beta-alanine ligase [Opitutaceae bacterium]|tara:strand:- start:1743 stop:2507 length:765 start_codon:yes stop_codon:yes gene_type:complete